MKSQYKREAWLLADNVILYGYKDKYGFHTILRKQVIPVCKKDIGKVLFYDKETAFQHMIKDIIRKKCVDVKPFSTITFNVKNSMQFVSAHTDDRRGRVKSSLKQRYIEMMKLLDLNIKIIPEEPMKKLEVTK